jgi:hypothetical protein
MAVFKTRGIKTPPSAIFLGLPILMPSFEK